MTMKRVLKTSKKAKETSELEKLRKEAQYFRASQEALLEINERLEKENRLLKDQAQKDYEIVSPFCMG
jgi:hypothetical protein